MANWGDGLATSAALLKALPLSDPNPFFQALMKQPYLNQACLYLPCLYTSFAHMSYLYTT